MTNEELTCALNALTARVSALEASRPVPNYAQRSLDQDFIIDPNRPALAFYTMELTADALVTGTKEATVIASVDSIAVAQATNLATVTLNSILGILGASGSSTQRKVMALFVTAGSTVRLTSSGAGSAVLVSSLEVLL